MDSFGQSDWYISTAISWGIMQTKILGGTIRAGGMGVKINNDAM